MSPETRGARKVAARKNVSPIRLKSQRVACVCVALSLAIAFGDSEAASIGLDPRQSNISVEFRQETRSASAAEVIEGRIHHRPPDLTVIEVYQPIAQRLRIDASSTVIYYPEEGRALRLPSNSPLDLPFFQMFVNVSGAGPDLSRLGFRISGSETDGDSLMVRWDPPDVLRSRLGHALCVFRDDLLVRLEFHSPKGKLLEQTRYGGYVKSGARSFPLEMEMARYGTEPTLQRTTFWGLRVGEALPDSVLSFRLPPDVEMEDIVPK